MTTKKQSLLQQNCLGVVLTGGLSSRMGEDKALLSRDDHKNKTNNVTNSKNNMLSFSTEQLTKAGVDSVVISGKQHGIADKFENLGPMGGIYTIIKKYQPKSLLILPVDLPLIDYQSLQQLKLIGELSQQACFYHDNFLPLYLPTTAFVEQFFDQAFLPFKRENTIQAKSGVKKGPSIKAMLKQVPHKILYPTNSHSLFNANTPEQWQQAKQQFQKNRKVHV